MDYHDYAIGFENAVSSLSAWMLCGMNSDGEQVQLPAGLEPRGWHLNQFVGAGLRSAEYVECAGSDSARI